MSGSGALGTARTIMPGRCGPCRHDSLPDLPRCVTGPPPF